jgi:hypothetical protein
LDCTLDNGKNSVEIFEWSCFAESEIGFKDTELIDYPVMQGLGMTFGHFDVLEVIFGGVGIW